MRNYYFHTEFMEFFRLHPSNPCRLLLLLLLLLLLYIYQTVMITRHSSLPTTTFRPRPIPSQSTCPTLAPAPKDNNAERGNDEEEKGSRRKGAPAFFVSSFCTDAMWQANREGPTPSPPFWHEWGGRDGDSGCTGAPTIFFSSFLLLMRRGSQPGRVKPSPVAFGANVGG